jgi:hypothetical protein
MKIAFLQDFFHTEIIGGAEQNDSVLLHYFEKQDNLTIVPVHTYHFESVADCYDFFIVSNFTRLSEEAKRYLINKKNYIIYEHDHKYVSNRNPAAFNNFKIPRSNIINYEFYKNAKKIFVLSKVCKTIMENTLNLENIINIGCSLWSAEKLNLLRKIEKNTSNQINFSIMDSSNPIKGTKQAQQFCNKRNIQPHAIGNKDYKIFMNQLSETEHFIFFPQVLETFSRVTAEAKMLNCKIITTPAMIGFFSEDYSNLSGANLIDKVEKQIELALPKFKDSVLS